MKHAPRKSGSSWNTKGNRATHFTARHNKHGRTGDWSHSDQRRKTGRYEFTELKLAPIFYPRGS